MSLKTDDLKGTVLEEVSVDEFEPKAGNDKDVIVVAFFLTDKEPAEDLNTFIQRGAIDCLDVEVSPNTDEDGRYLVFVEMGRNSTFFNKFKALLRDIENVAGKTKWKIRTYLSDGSSFEIDDPQLQTYIITDPAKYVSKEKFMKDSLQESVKSFLQNAHINYLNFADNEVIMSTYSNSISAIVEDIGEYDAVIGRNFLAESAFRLTNVPIEAKVLSAMLGVYNVNPIGKFLCVSLGDNVMLLKNTEIKYKG